MNFCTADLPLSFLLFLLIHSLRRCYLNLLNGLLTSALLCHTFWNQKCHMVKNYLFIVSYNIVFSTEQTAAVYLTKRNASLYCPICSNDLCPLAPLLLLKWRAFSVDCYFELYLLMIKSPVLLVVFSLKAGRPGSTRKTHTTRCEQTVGELFFTLSGRVWRNRIWHFLVSVAFYFREKRNWGFLSMKCRFDTNS